VDAPSWRHLGERQAKSALGRAWRYPSTILRVTKMALEFSLTGTNDKSKSEAHEDSGEAAGSEVRCLRHTWVPRGRPGLKRCPKCGRPNETLEEDDMKIVIDDNWLAQSLGTR